MAAGPAQPTLPPCSQLVAQHPSRATAPWCGRRHPGGTPPLIPPAPACPPTAGREGQPHLIWSQFTNDVPPGSPPQQVRSHQKWQKGGHPAPGVLWCCAAAALAGWLAGWGSGRPSVPGALGSQAVLQALVFSSAPEQADTPTFPHHVCALEPCLRSHNTPASPHPACALAPRLHCWLAGRCS